jgi:hypothetical protein
MSYEEKGSLVYLVVVIGTYAAYVGVVINRAEGGALADVAYRSPLLWSIGISIGLSIVGRILIEILRPSDTHKLDARDRDINRFGEYVGGGVLAVGMLVPFILALLAADHFWITNAMYAIFALSTVVGTTAKLIAYRRGL